MDQVGQVNTTNLSQLLSLEAAMSAKIVKICTQRKFPAIQVYVIT